MSCSFAGNLHCALQGNSFAPAGERKAPSKSKVVNRPRDFNARPLLVIWEMTQACDLSCMHCRANAHSKRHPLQLATAEAFHLIDQIANMQVPLFVLTGGDPLKRPD